MELQEPPIYIVVPGRVYRPDTADATHVPMFHQLEGLAIDEDLTLADLQGTLIAFARQMFGEHTDVRLRPGYFPSLSDMSYARISSSLRAFQATRLLAP